MFDIGFWEILLILILALLVVGPERLPGAARTAGFWFGKARRYIEGVRDEVSQEFDVGELKRLIHNQEVQINELQQKLHAPLSLDDEKDTAEQDSQAPGSAPEYEIVELDDGETAARKAADESPANEVQADEDSKRS